MDIPFKSKEETKILADPHASMKEGNLCAWKNRGAGFISTLHSRRNSAAGCYCKSPKIGKS
jgi:hypothetical protein